jgi:hypothetical protein
MLLRRISKQSLIGLMRPGHEYLRDGVQGRDQRLNGRFGSGTENPCVFGTSGSMWIVAFELRPQECQIRTFENS